MQHQQQQQQVPGVVQQTYIASPYQRWSVVDTYAHRQSTVIGALLVIAGALSIIFSVVGIAVLSMNTAGGRGLSCGALVIIAGAFGIAAGRQKSNCKIVAFMVLTIIGAMFTFGEAYTSVMSAVAVRISYGEYRDNDYDCSGDNERCAKMKAKFAIAILLAVLGAFEFFLCLWGSILTCATGRCCGNYPPSYVMMPAGQQEMTVLTQQQQPQLPGAYPPAYEEPAPVSKSPGQPYQTQ